VQAAVGRDRNPVILRTARQPSGVALVCQGFVLHTEGEIQVVAVAVRALPASWGLDFFLFLWGHSMRWFFTMRITSLIFTNWAEFLDVRRRKEADWTPTCCHRSSHSAPRGLGRELRSGGRPVAAATNRHSSTGAKVSRERMLEWRLSRFQALGGAQSGNLNSRITA
jgi:hypothetical protein